MNKYKCLIVDDEFMAGLLVEEYIKNLPQLELVKICQNGLQALEMLNREKIDILFLDIQMPQLNGIELVNCLQYNTAVIFTTAFSEHAVEGFKLDVVDYLLKPFSLDRFVQAVTKAIRYLNSGPAQNPIAKDHFFVKSSGKWVKIAYEEIYFIEGLKEYVNIYHGKEMTVTLQALKNLETLLPVADFKRIHKSFIINIRKIKSLEGNQIEIKEKKLPIGSTYREELFTLLGLGKG